MRNEFIDKANELNDAHEAYAVAMIVRRKLPSSGKPGDHAIITENGQIHGWIGGGCTRGIVLKEALLSLQDQKPRLVCISPSAKQDTADTYTKTYIMTCQSGGEVEVYIEPVLPKLHLVIFGTSSIAMSLARIASSMDYRVDVVSAIDAKDSFPTASQHIDLEDYSSDYINANSAIVVCTQGDGDMQALKKAITSNPKYLGYVASRKKGASMFGDLRKMGVHMDQLKTIKTPAGIDIKAKLPEEVAISILAQIIEEFRSDTPKAEKEAPPQIEMKNEDFYMNPVCNIPVMKSSAKHIIQYKGENVYFCCDGCKVSFEKNPAQYMTA